MLRDPQRRTQSPTPRRLWGPSQTQAACQGTSPGIVDGEAVSQSSGQQRPGRPESVRRDLGQGQALLLSFP